MFADSRTTIGFKTDLMHPLQELWMIVGCNKANTGRWIRGCIESKGHGQLQCWKICIERILRIDGRWNDGTKEWIESCKLNFRFIAAA
jgi:hypothetical protein